MEIPSNHAVPERAAAIGEGDREAIGHAHEGPVDLVIFGLVGVAAIVNWLGVIPAVKGIDVLAVTAVLAGGFPAFREALANLLARRMTMELSPKRALVRRNGEIQELPISDVRAGDVVVIRPAAEIPVDGVVLAGHSTVDQSSITGESRPAEKGCGATVFAGTTNHAGALEIRTDRVGRDTVFGRIFDAVEKAEQSRAPIQKPADRLSGWLVYFALGSAAITFALTGNLRSTIAVVIVAGACGIAAGTPLAVLGAIGRAAQGGAIVKGGRYMEALGSIDTVVLDKTGTLTFGEPSVTGVMPCPGVDPVELLQCAAIAEGPSEHPLARAILKEAARMHLPLSDPETFEYPAGQGSAEFVERQRDSGWQRCPLERRSEPGIADSQAAGPGR